MNEHKEIVQIIPQGARQSITFIQSKKMNEININKTEVSPIQPELEPRKY